MLPVNLFFGAADQPPKKYIVTVGVVGQVHRVWGQACRFHVLWKTNCRSLFKRSFYVQMLALLGRDFEVAVLPLPRWQHRSDCNMLVH